MGVIIRHSENYGSVASCCLLRISMTLAEKRAWFNGLSFKGTFALVIIAVGLLAGAIWIVNTTGKQEVLEESSKVIEATGNNIVEGLMGRSKEIASLARGIATF